MKRRDGSATARVWLRADLEPVWAKYLAPGPIETIGTSATSATPLVAAVPRVPLVALVVTGTSEEEDPGYLASLDAEALTLELIDDAA